ncbi:hypothetical protein IE81DRAFT_122937 [Ceraceosorus guamensis]|uniref:Uncharacterized protein n=1 Tax=Ceraceosorus guamensis TaxID=1522189 RepID=A0A316VY97_9BASI|nr:hypothetical protein IE81DRAFT_122937 [Ceraceosorus guamensis]PWN42429.1 hypothetical protein IE81DRAFT_122937 [Ceraceosorus guamensis]
MPSVPKWGQGLFVTTLMALIGEGAKLYGSQMTFQPLDQEIFYEYICLPRHRKVLKPALLAIFDDYNFMPLTLSSINPLTEVRLTTHSHLVAQPSPPEGGWMAWIHLISDPDIINAAWRAGFRPQDHPRLSDWICQRVVMRLKPFKTVRNVAAKLKELQDAGLVVITKSFAASVICDLRLTFEDSSWQKDNGPNLEVQGDQFTREAYFALVHLDSMGYLAFDLRSLATDLLRRLEQWRGDMTLGPLYRQLEIDFDGINGTHQIACTTFWMAQQEGHPLRWVKTELAGRKVELSTLRRILLSNFQKSVLPFEYAYSVLGASQGRALLASTLPHLVRESFQGDLLKSLLRPGTHPWRHDAENLLRKVVECYNISVSDLDYQYWDVQRSGAGKLRTWAVHPQPCSALACKFTKGDLKKASRIRYDLGCHLTQPLQDLGPLDSQARLESEQNRLSAPASSIVSPLQLSARAQRYAPCTKCGWIHSTRADELVCEGTPPAPAAAENDNDDDETDDFSPDYEEDSESDDGDHWTAYSYGTASIFSNVPNRAKGLVALQAASEKRSWRNGTAKRKYLHQMATATPLSLESISEFEPKSSHGREIKDHYGKGHIVPTKLQDIVKEITEQGSTKMWPNTYSTPGDAVIQLFAPDSLHADIVMKHTIACGHKRAILDLYEKGVPPTLEHARMALHFGWGLPESFFNKIIDGAKIRLDGISSEHCSDEELGVGAMKLKAPNPRVEDYLHSEEDICTIKFKRVHTDVALEVLPGQAPCGEIDFRDRALIASVDAVRSEVALEPSSTRTRSTIKSNGKHTSRNGGSSSLSSASSSQIQADIAPPQDAAATDPSSGDAVVGIFENQPFSIPRSDFERRIASVQTWIRQLRLLEDRDRPRMDLLRKVCEVAGGGSSVSQDNMDREDEMSASQTENENESGDEERDGDGDGDDDDDEDGDGLRCRNPFSSPANIALTTGLQRLADFEAALIVARTNDQAEIVGELAWLLKDIRKRAARGKHLRVEKRIKMSLAGKWVPPRKVVRNRRDVCTKWPPLEARDLTDEDEDPNFADDESDTKDDSELSDGDVADDAAPKSDFKEPRRSTRALRGAKKPLGVPPIESGKKPSLGECEVGVKRQSIAQKSDHDSDSAAASGDGAVSLPDSADYCYDSNYDSHGYYIHDD